MGRHRDVPPTCMADLRRLSPHISPIDGCGHGYTGKSSRSAGAVALLRTIHGAHPADALRATQFAPGESVDVLSSRPARPNCRAPCLCRHLRAFASRIGEICGLGVCAAERESAVTSPPRPAPIARFRHVAALRSSTGRRIGLEWGTSRMRPVLPRRLASLPTEGENRGHPAAF